MHTEQTNLGLRGKSSLPASLMDMKEQKVACSRVYPDFLRQKEKILQGVLIPLTGAHTTEKVERESEMKNAFDIKHHKGVDEKTKESCRTRLGD